ncbi:hypothetical protein BALAC2494_01709 [Bifidobacterium animalis subsp. lactis CNCM I-2494]|uniref:Uncharacterized protein n=1 Tax=Bifidobacterium animalis subsp. lactis CNCM I-2494 TaxID=1042403 RepID=A0A806FKR7_BIFAN|nr:hypothetical protein BALAC2494_01709 [Bifidobacterium animalis subsp. lactis CNCM I-2494]
MSPRIWPLDSPVVACHRIAQTIAGDFLVRPHLPQKQKLANSRASFRFS